MLVFFRFLRICPLMFWPVLLFQLHVGVSADEETQRTGPPDRAQSVIAVIRTDRQTYSLADTVKLEFSLQNTGDKTVYVDRRMFWGGLAGGLKLVMSDQRGNPVPPPMLMDALMPPPKEGDTSILIPLGAGFSYGTWVELPVREHFHSFGRYSIQVTYQSRLPKYLVAPSLRGLPALWDDTPEIHSDLLSISVTR